MNIRPFDWRDIPALHRYRNDCIFLHSSLLLTRGPMLMSGALLSFFTSAAGIYTSVGTLNGVEASKSRGPLISQVIHPPGSQQAHMTFITPGSALETNSPVALIEHLSTQVVEYGGFRLLADVDERSDVFATLKQNNFAIYARQRIWKLKQEEGDARDGSWKEAEDADLIPVRSLYTNVVPGLVQQVEPFPVDRLNGLVFRQGPEILAYVEIKYGHQGIWVQPFIHPDAEDVVDNLTELLSHLPRRRSRPVYLCIRSYQSWLESAVEDMGGEPGPSQAVLVKHLAVPQKALRSFSLPALEGGQPEITAPFARTQVQSQPAPHAQLERHS